MSENEKAKMSREKFGQKNVRGRNAKARFERKEDNPYYRKPYADRRNGESKHDKHGDRGNHGKRRHGRGFGKDIRKATLPSIQLKPKPALKAFLDKFDTAMTVVGCTVLLVGLALITQPSDGRLAKTSAGTTFACAKCGYINHVPPQTNATETVSSEIR